MVEQTSAVGQKPIPVKSVNSRVPAEEKLFKDRAQHKKQAVENRLHPDRETRARLPSANETAPATRSA